MNRAKLVCMSLMFVGCSFLLAQDDDKIKSGPKVGAALPKPFEVFNVNGPAKGRPRCLVCKFALSPSVLIFVRKPAEDKDKPVEWDKAFTELLRQFDKVALEFEETNFSAGVVVISPDARDSTNNAQAGSVGDLTKDLDKDSDEAAQRIRVQAKKLIDEAISRANLLKGLTERTGGLKHVVVGFVPEVPKDFEINPKAEVTIIFYERIRVTGIYAYGPGAMRETDVKMIVDRVRKALEGKPVPAEEKAPKR